MDDVRPPFADDFSQPLVWARRSWDFVARVAVAAGLLLALTIAVSGTLAARTGVWQSSPLGASHGRDPGEADAPTVATILDAE